MGLGLLAGQPSITICYRTVLIHDAPRKTLTKQLLPLNTAGVATGKEAARNDAVVVIVVDVAAALDVNDDAGHAGERRADYDLIDVVGVVAAAAAVDCCSCRCSCSCWCCCCDGCCWKFRQRRSLHVLTFILLLLTMNMGLLLQTLMNEWET